jgi:hypothetical protein
MAASGDPMIERGVCHALFAYDVGFAINLDEAERRITEITHREIIRHRKRAPRVLQFDPPPLRVAQAGQEITLGVFSTTGTVDAVLYDFGAVSIAYHIPLRGRLKDLLTLSETLHEHEGLLVDSRRRVDALLATAGPAVAKPHVPAFVEDYAIYQVEAWKTARRPAEIIEQRAELIAQILRCEPGVLSEQEIADALSCQLAYGPNDATVIDWNAALVLDAEAEDVRTVLEFANVELLEMRVLDQQLDKALAEAYDVLSHRRLNRAFGGHTSAASLRRVAQLQADNALLFEGVNNTLKLLGDQFLARAYRLASQRFHLNDWDASILRKLSTLESIYQKLADQHSHWRLEVLEWIVIILIALEIVLATVPGLRH